MTQTKHQLAASRHRKLFELLRQENLAARNIVVRVKPSSAQAAMKPADDMIYLAKMAGESLCP